MAIEIIPKAQRPRPRAELIDALFYLSLILLLLSFLSYFVLDRYERQARLEIGRIEKSLREKETPEIKLLEEGVLKTQKRIAVFADLWNNHRRSSLIFPLLADFSHPQVFFSGLELNTAVSEVILSGSTESFRILQEQVLIFEREPRIAEVNLRGIGFDRQGKVGFSLKLRFNPEAFK